MLFAEGRISTTGVLVMIVATFGWALGSVWSKRPGGAHSPLVATAMQMIAGGLVLLLASFPKEAIAHDEWSLLASNPPDLAAMLGALINGAAVVGWIITRTKGISFIPGLETAETPQAADTLCALLGALAAFAAWAGTVPTVVSSRRRAPSFGGRKPANRNVSVGKPETLKPVNTAEAPGRATTRSPAWTASRTSL